MPQIAELVRWDYGPISGQDAPEWRSVSEWRALIYFGVAALMAAALICTRYGL